MVKKVALFVLPKPELITNSKEENKDYEYNYFENNSSTKIGDISNELLEEEIRNEGINLDNINSNSYRKSDTFIVVISRRQF